MIIRNNWFVRFNPKSISSIKLFCFHYAGGGASAFYSWSSKIIESAEIIAVQLPGRETRFGKKPLTDIENIVDELFINFEKSDITSNKPFVFFGHRSRCLDCI